MPSSTNAVALVTGARCGIGRAIADALTVDGYRAVRVSRHIEESTSSDGISLRCDVTNREEVHRAVALAMDHFGRIDVLVNSAGRSNLARIEELEPLVIEELLAVNLLGAVHCAQEVLPVMRDLGGGAIINIGSLRGKSCAPGKAAYSISKFAMRAFSLTLEREMAEEGIRVTLINPGFAQTELIHHRIGEECLRPEDLTQPEDIANAVRFALQLSPGAALSELDIGRIW